MDLSDAERAIVEVIRLSALGDMSLSITRASGVVVVTVASPEPNGITIGAGPTLDAAVFSLLGLGCPSDPGGEPAQPEPAKVLRLVGGTHGPAADARHCIAMEAA